MYIFKKLNYRLLSLKVWASERCVVFASAVRRTIASVAFPKLIAAMLAFVGTCFYLIASCFGYSWLTSADCLWTLCFTPVMVGPVDTLVLGSMSGSLMAVGEFFLSVPSLLFAIIGYLTLAGSSVLVSSTSAYSGVAVYAAVCVVLALIIFGLSYVVATHLPDSAKRSAYECGFEAFTDSRVPFDVRFYLVGILFIVFDLEAAFLYPWAANLGHLGGLGFWSMIDFVVELCVGLAYVWLVGSLEW